MVQQSARFGAKICNPTAASLAAVSIPGHVRIGGVQASSPAAGTHSQPHVAGSAIRGSTGLVVDTGGARIILLPIDDTKIVSKLVDLIERNRCAKAVAHLHDLGLPLGSGQRWLAQHHAGRMTHHAVGVRDLCAFAGWKERAA